jgi:hypothetical protein
MLLIITGNIIAIPTAINDTKEAPYVISGQCGTTINSINEIIYFSPVKNKTSLTIYQFRLKEKRGPQGPLVFSYYINFG